MAGKNEVTIDVVVREHGGKKVIKDVGDEAKKTGTKFDETGKDAKKLGKEMYELEVRLRNAAKEFKRTGEIDLDLAKTLRRNQSQLRSLTKLRNELLSDSGGGGAASGAAEVGGRFGQELTKSLMALRGPALVSVGVLAAAMAPFLGAAIGSAVVGGAGAGGIIGGIALAARDPRVQDEGAKLGAHLGEVFGRAGEPFIAPTVEAMHVLSGVADDVSGDMKQAFATVAPVLVPLAQGIGGLVDQTMPGFIKAMEAAKPVLRVVADELPEVGRSLSYMFETISEDPDGAIMAMKTLFQIIDGTIRMTGDLVHGLGKVYEWTQKSAAAASDWMTSVPGWVGAVLPQFGLLQQYSASLNDELHAQVGSINRAKDTSRDYVGSLEAMAGSSKKAREKIDELNSAIDTFIGKQLGVDQAVVQWNKGLIDLKKELTDGKRIVSLNTEEGLRNRDALLQQIEAAESLRKKTFEQTGDLSAANAQYQDNIQMLYNMAVAAGISRKELDLLFAPYLNGPRIVVTEFQFPGLLEGLAEARELARLLGSESAAARYRAGDTSGYGGGRASGGFIAPGMTVDVAESGTGVERVKMLRGGGAIVSNMDQWSAAGGGGWSGGGGVQTVRLLVEVRSDGGEFNDMIARTIRVQVADIGGGDVQRTYGQRMN